MADPTPTLQDQQLELAHHLRDPANIVAPSGIEDRRLGIYRDLLHNNIRSLLAGNFPVICKTLGDGVWQALVRDFVAHHRSHTPLFTEIGREFIAFVESRAEAGMDDPAWLPELAHYEWVELALQISDTEVPAGIDANMDLLDGIPVVSPQAWALAYRWPVHRIGPAHVPAQASEAPTLLLVRRDTQGDIRFAELSPLAFRLLERLAGNTRDRGRDVLAALATEAGVDEVASFVEEGRAMLERMQAEGTLLGARGVG